MNIQTITGDIVEGNDVDVQCVISRVYPDTMVSAYWSSQSFSDVEAGSPTVDECDPEGVCKLTYKTTLEFTRDDHTLTCHVTWRGQDEYLQDDYSLTVLCKYTSGTCVGTSKHYLHSKYNADMSVNYLSLHVKSFPDNT